MPQNLRTICRSTNRGGAPCVGVGRSRSLADAPTHQLCARYKSTYDDDTATETEAMVDQAIMRVPLLVLDDVGSTKHTEWAESKLFALLDARYGDEKATIITLNVPPEKLGHPRIMSRLLDRASSVVVAFEGPDHRQLRDAGSIPQEAP